MAFELSQSQAESLRNLPNLNQTVMERFMPEDTQRAMERAGEFLTGYFAPEVSVRTTHLNFTQLKALLAAYDLRMLEFMFEDEWTGKF